MNRSVKTSLKFINAGKRKKLERFLFEYHRILKIFVQRFWELEEIPLFLKSDCESWLSARAKQCAAKQAGNLIRNVRKKHDARKFVIKKLIDQKDFSAAEKLQAIQDKNKVSIPNIDKIDAALDSRFCKISYSDKFFDLWVSLSSFGEREKIILPLKKNKSFNKWMKMGNLCLCIRLNKDEITFFFEYEPIKAAGSMIGIDVGLKKTFSTSVGSQTQADAHGHTLQAICEKLTRKKKGSKAFLRAQNHRKNYIRWSVNQLNLSDVSEVRIENIKNLRKGKATSALLSRWNYADIFRALTLKCEELGVQVTRVQNAYTSRRCHACGWTDKRNRKGETFKCRECGHATNADINAARNIALNLSIERRPDLDRFYWLKQELIVPVAKII